MKFKRENDSGGWVYTILRNLDGKLFEKRATRSEAIPERVHFVKLPCTHIFPYVGSNHNEMLYDINSVTKQT